MSEMSSSMRSSLQIPKLSVTVPFDEGNFGNHNDSDECNVTEEHNDDQAGLTGMQLPNIIKLEDLFRKQTTGDSHDESENATPPISPGNTSVSTTRGLKEVPPLA